MSKPQPELHARIENFDERVLVMSSIRKPKRLTIRGNNERDYPFLVKVVRATHIFLWGWGW